jgi:hypothetical protein
MRVCLTARAVGFDALEPHYANELQKPYRNPGLTVRRAVTG